MSRKIIYLFLVYNIIMFKKKKKQLDFLAIGDVVIDAFIQLQDAETHCDIDDNNCKISMNWGDKIPYKKLTVVAGVGNAPNAAVSAARLGLNSGILTHIGQDRHGQECLDSFKNNKVDTSVVQTQNGKDTNYHFVLSFNAERTILIKHEEFNYDLKSHLQNSPAPRWVYFSSVGEDSMQYHADIASYVKDNPEAKMAFQPGTFQISLGPEKLKDIYQNTELFFCNVQEAQKILKTDQSEVLELLKEMRDLGPNIVCITDGPNGAYAYDGTDAWFHPIYPDPSEPKERTGAGDSFSSTFTSALAYGMSLDQALAWGPINSMNVVQHIGAQEGLLTKEKLEEFLANAPADYKAKKIN